MLFSCLSLSCMFTDENSKECQGLLDISNTGTEVMNRNKPALSGAYHYDTFQTGKRRTPPLGSNSHVTATATVHLIDNVCCLAALISGYPIIGYHHMHTHTMMVCDRHGVLDL